MDQPTPEQYQPRLTPWAHTWRLAVCAVLSGLVWSMVVRYQWTERPWLFWVDVVLGLAAYVLVFWRRRHPLLVAVVTGAFTVASGIAAGPATLAAVSLATRQRIRPVLLVAVVGIVAAQGYNDWQVAPAVRDPIWLTFAFNVVITAGMLGWGMYIGSRRELLWTLRARAERAETEQEMRVAQARTTERARIAREMHDVLAHRISQISVLAGALGFRTDLTPDEMREGAQRIQERSHEALEDLRAVLGVLRDDRTGEVLDRPQPTYADLTELVGEARGAGLTVDFEDRVVDGEVPVVVGRTVYRIVQEGITNAHKHAPGSRLSVCITGGPGEGLEVLLRNPVGFARSQTPGSGLGLIGLSERADLHGGRLDYRREGPTWVLRGWIPWPA
ncbi:sensor histidine kinase [Nocardioides sp. GXQ0305]|uniref:sensor histidine kinase n=1 Tax=Nocardioides sp. GXQ0305 TaxID=3423912 RepID=UPI003D7EAD89